MKMGTTRVLVRNLVKRQYFEGRQPLQIIWKSDGKEAAVLDAAKSISHNLNLPLLTLEHLQQSMARLTSKDYAGSFAFLSMDLGASSDVERPALLKGYAEQASLLSRFATAGVALLNNVENYDPTTAETAKSIVDLTTQSGKMVILLSAASSPAFEEYKTFEVDQQRPIAWIVERVSQHLKLLETVNPHLLKLCALKLSPNAAYEHSLAVTGNKAYAETLRWLAILRRDHGEDPVKQLMRLK
jgi:hypothetical protein